jgi:endonuclease/exonuclease/phosphatase family metal-dependent hydrolase
MRVRCWILLCVVCLGGAWAAEPPVPKPETLRIMSFNIWGGGERSKLPLFRTAEVINAAKADLVGLQESYGEKRKGVAPDNAKEIARALGWNHVDQGDGKTILSRYEIIGLTPGKQGAEIRLPDGQSFYLFNVHLFHAPYQPYQLLKIPYEEAPFLDTADQLVQAAESARGPELQRALAEIQPLLAAGKFVALTGDFNEPSHLDWTANAMAAGIVPMAVAYPASTAAIAIGLVDSYRAAHPDEVNYPGWTWTPLTKENDPADRHDRIDFVYVAPGLEVLRSAVVGEGPPRADITVKPYPSDHRAVVTEVRLPDRLAQVDAKVLDGSLTSR